ncbi:hypothetical protein XENOCAPTIV_001853, partial [Xenoophorus captivus]
QKQNLFPQSVAWSLLEPRRHGTHFKNYHSMMWNWRLKVNRKPLLYHSSGGEK